MSNNINNMYGRRITVVGGNQYNNGTSDYGMSDPFGPHLEQIRWALDAVRLPHTAAAQARTELDALDTSLTTQEDESAIAHRLRRLTEVLVASGAVAAAGQALVEPLSAIAGWLGEYGHPVLQALSI